MGEKVFTASDIPSMLSDQNGDPVKYQYILDSIRYGQLKRVEGIGGNAKHVYESSLREWAAKHDFKLEIPTNGSK